MQLQTIAVLTLTLAGFALRLYYLTTTHPFYDEYTTVLAAREILRHGWPILPSGLFYEHGLLATYLIAPFTALYINAPLLQWQPAHWGLMLSRWPSVLLGTATIPLIFAIGRHCFTPDNPKSKIQNPKSLLAAGLFALGPEGMVWGGRARMYALATLLVLLTVYWAYRGARYPAPAKYRWWALLTLLATLLTQFGALMLVPSLVVSMVVVGWLSRPNQAEEQGSRGTGKRSEYVSGFTFHAPPPWFLRKSIFLEGPALAAIIGFAIFIKRLGRPLGFAPLGDRSDNLLGELVNTVAYQAAFHFTWPDTIDFFARQFGVPHHFWLTMVTVVGMAAGSILWLARRVRGKPTEISQSESPASHLPFLISNFQLFLWLVFGLIILQMVTLLEPFRRNPRYLILYLPFFYLIAAGSIGYLLSVIGYHLAKLFGRFSISQSLVSNPSTSPSTSLRAGLRTGLQSPIPNLQSFDFAQDKPRISNLLPLLLLALFTTLGFDDLRLALVTPEPAYEEAMAFVWTHWQPGDHLLTMNTSAAGLYLGRADGFTVQNDATQFLLNPDSAPVDRWLGVPWVGRATDFNRALNIGERTWFVIDTIRQPVYFRGDWLAVVNRQMEPVWAGDNALVYRTRADRIPLPTQPDTVVDATLDDAIRLVGFTLRIPKAQSFDFAQGRAQDSSPIPGLQLTLFWQPLTALQADYTTFLHLRNEAGATVAQHDGQPLDGAYPTGYWQLGETVIDPITLSIPKNLPAGHYSLLVGMYRLDTLERLPVANDVSGENAILLAEVILP